MWMNTELCEQIIVSVPRNHLRQRPQKPPIKGRGWAQESKHRKNNVAASPWGWRKDAGLRRLTPQFQLLSLQSWVDLAPSGGMHLGVLQGHRPHSRRRSEGREAHFGGTAGGQAHHGWHQLAPTSPQQVVCQFSGHRDHLAVELSQRQTFTTAAVLVTERQTNRRPPASSAPNKPSFSSAPSFLLYPVPGTGWGHTSCWDEMQGSRAPVGSQGGTRPPTLRLRTGPSELEPPVGLLQGPQALPLNKVVSWAKKT